MIVMRRPRRGAPEMEVKVQVAFGAGPFIVAGAVDMTLDDLEWLQYVAIPAVRSEWEQQGGLDRAGGR